MARKKRREEEPLHQAWAIPYGDFVTLLLAFFVVMYAVSSVNEGKYRVLSDSLNAAFRGTPTSVEPLQVGDGDLGPGADLEMSLTRDELHARQMLEAVPLNAKDDLVNKLGQPGYRRANETGPIRGGVVDRSTASRLGQIADSVQASVANLVANDLVTVRRTRYAVEVEIKADVLFASGSATLSPTAVDVITRLADVFRDYPNAIRVEGHTDNLPIKSTAFPSNWELSAARAASVVRVLATNGVNPVRLEVLGLAEYRPTMSNETPDGRNTNRRVMILILNGSPQPNPPAAADAAQAAGAQRLAQTP
jgi:chemotaxis protein MotB